ncbi:MAG: Fe-S oxidoreductase [Clostridia bacterium]|nr:Fe-S oxidoreductase [Clostridia bacterium]
MRRELGFGMMRLPLTEPGNSASVDIETTRKMVDRFLEAGFTYFDTAFPYHEGRSETAVRETLTERYPREAYQLATKLPTFSLENADGMRSIFDKQFEKCGVDYFDRYLIHNINGETVHTADRLDVWDFVLREKENGRLKSVGFSFHDDADLLDRILKDHPEMEFVQLQINYLNWEDAAIQSRRCYETARRHGKDIIIMEPVHGGALAALPEEAAERAGAQGPAEQAALALRFAAALDGVIMTLSGMSTPEQLDANLALFTDMEPLSAEEEAALPEVVEILRRDIRVPCTGCNYCSACPQHIPISRYFALLNNYKGKSGQFSPQQMYYNNAVKQGYGRAEDCIECRLCEEHCPQHIHVADKMKEVSKTFDHDQAAG